MSARLVLGAAAVLVLGASVYLFLQVRAKPAEAQASGGRTAAKESTPGEPKPSPDAKRTERAIPAPTSPDTNVAAKTDPAIVRQASGAIAKLGEVGDPSAIEDAAIADANGKPGYKLDAIMAEANKAYDKMELDDARAYAQRVLKRLPTNARMLRIMVSSACIEGDQPEAQKHFNLLPERDREQMKTRCMKYQVQFTDPPATK